MKAKSDGNKFSTVTFEFTICGKETLVSNSNIGNTDFLFKINSTAPIGMANLAGYFYTIKKSFLLNSFTLIPGLESKQEC